MLKSGRDCYLEKLPERGCNTQHLLTVYMGKDSWMWYARQIIYVISFNYCNNLVN